MEWVLIAYAATVLACFGTLMRRILAYGDPDFFLDDVNHAIITSLTPIANMTTYLFLTDRNFVVQYYGGYEDEG